MSIKLGNSNITLKVGSSAVTAAYLGSTQVYPQGEPPTPVGFKYKLTLSNGDVISAACDGTSAITEAEISAYTSTLVSAEIGDSVSSIGGWAFYRCESLTSIDIPSSVTSIGDNAFHFCSSLQSIDIPDSVTSIGEDVFAGCESLTSIDIPNSVTSIGSHAFDGCRSLTSITIPSGWTSINDGMFKNCTSLTSIGPIGSGASVEIPNSVTIIKSDAFEGCSGLINIDIPSGVTSIGIYAFYYSPNLSSITVEAVVPPTLGESAFDETNNCPIYVDCSVVEDFKQASGWSTYESRIACRPTHEYVDLGLPSGTLWAKTNVGATNESDYGEYYMYGKGADTYQVTSGDSAYSGTENPLAASADTATQVWGGNWHTPTHVQWQELTTNTTYTWTTINGVNGGKFTASNGNYVFFPAAGYWLGDIQNFVGSEGGYWSSSPYDSSDAYRLNFNTFFNDVNSYYSRSSGNSIRPVMDN